MLDALAKSSPVFAKSVPGRPATGSAAHLSAPITSQVFTVMVMPQLTVIGGRSIEAVGQPLGVQVVVGDLSVQEDGGLPRRTVDELHAPCARVKLDHPGLGLRRVEVYGAVHLHRRMCDRHPGVGGRNSRTRR